MYAVFTEIQFSFIQLLMMFITKKYIAKACCELPLVALYLARQHYVYKALKSLSVALIRTSIDRSVLLSKTSLKTLRKL